MARPAWLLIAFGVALCSAAQLDDGSVSARAAGRRREFPADYARDVREEEEGSFRRPALSGRSGYSQVFPYLLPIGGVPLPFVVWPVPAPAAPTHAPAPRPECNLRHEETAYSDEMAYVDDEDNYVPKTKPRRPARRRPSPRPRDTFVDADDEEPKRPNTSVKPEREQYPAYVRAERLDETPSPPLFGVATSSKELLEKFRAQAPTAPELPPALLSEHDSSERVLRHDDYEIPESELHSEDPPASAPASAPACAPASASSRSYLPSQNVFALNVRSREPPRPRIERSLLLLGELTVPRADYTEAYTAWWDAPSGAARVHFHGGSAASFRTVLPNGSAQRLEMRVDRSGESEVRRCARADAAALAPADRAHPALPDLDLFSFAGYERDAVERWSHVRAGRAGELGGARGEALTFRHELLLRRAADGAVLPLRYTVAVDSSVLGADCDGYEHRYLDARELTREPKFFSPDTDQLCDTLERLNASTGEMRARLEPLREFTLPSRDLRYDEAIQRFKTEHGRRYLDDTEEAMRKNLFIQHSRFTLSANRQGATFELAVNFLGDRLDAELEELRGVRAEPERGRAERFPHPRAALRALQPRLPARFDWRPRGAVSPVRYQGACASCWAVAVGGAVEGALFVRTRRLTPLAEKCLVDCAQPFGGNGCRGTWPSHAYDYVQSRGLPALDAYPPYKDKVERCAADGVPAMTRISAHVNVTSNSVTALKVAIRRHAPSVVIVDSKPKSFVFYKKGVLYDDRCAKGPRKLDHAALAVGWGQRGGEPHFILKNSWSEAWGERGYVRLQAPANTCGVLAKPSYPRLEDADVLGGARDRSRLSTRHADDYSDDVADEL